MIDERMAPALIRIADLMELDALDRVIKREESLAIAASDDLARNARRAAARALKDRRREIGARRWPEAFS